MVGGSFGLPASTGPLDELPGIEPSIGGWVSPAWEPAELEGRAPPSRELAPVEPAESDASAGRAVSPAVAARCMELCSAADPEAMADTLLASAPAPTFGVGF